MELLKLLTSNYLIDVAVVSWFSAQVIKTALHYVTHRTWKMERMVGAGGMPSAHSAFVCSITVAMAKKMGYASPEFALALVFASVVMYDAMGVRRAAGEQAKVLNQMVFDFNHILDFFNPQKQEQAQQVEDERDGQKELNEFLGHTPLEVLGGAVLGICVALLFPVF